MNPHPALAPAGPRELCQLAVDWDGTLPDGGAMVEEKINGWRALWVNGELVTRGGAPFYGVSHISAALKAMEKTAGEPMMFDGEFQAGGSFDDTIAHQAQRGRANDAGTLHLFDAITMREWHAGGSELRLSARKDILGALVPAIGGNAPVQLMQDQWAFYADDVRAMARDVWTRGGEGVMVKDAQTSYLRSRNRSWMKLKS